MADPAAPVDHLIVGADGLIGRALDARLSGTGSHLLATSRRRVPVSGHIFLDLGRDGFGCWLPEKVTTAYVLAGMTNMAACAADVAASRRINVTGTLALARDLMSRGAHVVFVSTNLVFDGSMPFVPRHHPVSPQTVYATQKAEVETVLMASGQASVLRLSKVAETLAPLMAQWAADLAAGRAIHPFGDRVCAPVGLRRVVDALVFLGGRRRAGLHQLGGARDLSYAEVARLLARRMGIAEAFVQPVPAPVAGGQVAAVPPHTTIETDEDIARLSPEPPTVEAELEPVILSVIDGVGGT